VVRPDGYIAFSDVHPDPAAIEGFLSKAGLAL
jgi:hypothetical protein